MTDLIAVLTSDNGSWNHMRKLIEEGMFERVFLVCSKAAKNGFNVEGDKEVEFVVVDSLKPVKEVIGEIVEGLRGKVGFGEVGLNIASGNGKEHMALLSAIMKLGVGFRLVAYTKEGVREV